ncbi:MAG: amidohydrolase family protein, partial [Candidatus Hodarchaeota archaeon]
MSGKDSLAIVEGTLIDGTGKDPVGNSAVLVQNGRISNVGPMKTVKIPSGAEVISASGFTVMPGIIDAHVHFMGIRVALGSVVAGQVSPYVEIIRAANDAKKVLAAGVTSIADAGSPHAVELKKAVIEKEIPGPRFFVSGHALTQTGGHGDPRALPLEWARGGRIGGVLYTRVCDGVDEVRRVLREQIRNGADFV